jgi:hypothetical protein
VLCAGLSAAALAFAVLAMNAPAAIVRLGPLLPSVRRGPDYQILVGAAARGRHVAGKPTNATAVDLSAAGGISLAQYRVVSRLPGVAVAAPLTMIGYVPVKVTFPVTVPTAPITALPKLVAVTALYRGNSGPGAVTGGDPGSTYLTADPLSFTTGHSAPGPGNVAVPAADIRAMLCPGQTSKLRQQVVYVAVQPQTHCASTRTSPGSNAGRGAPRSGVSVSVGWTFLLPLVAVDPAAEARLLHLDNAVTRGRYLPATTGAQPGPVPMIVASSIDDNDEARLSVTTLPAGLTIGTATVTAAASYSVLVSHIGAAAVPVPAYWTTSAVSFGRSAGAGSLTRHVARAPGPGGASSPETALAAIGVFNPAKVTSPRATPSPPGAARLISQNANPAGYPSSAGTLVMPLQDIGAFTAPGAYTDTNTGKPIGSIRVRVAGVTDNDPLSLARVRAVAQEIARATGLRVDIMVAATSAVAIGLDPGRLELAMLVLPLGVAFFANGVNATLSGRRRDLLTLRALGWRRRQLRQQLLAEFALIALGGWILATTIALAIRAASPAPPTSWWPLLGSAAALAATVAAICWQVRSATAEPPRRPPKRSAIGVLVIALGCAALGQELAVRWVFHGVLVGTVLGRAVVWQSDPALLAAALTIVALTTLAVADVHWLHAGRRALEIRTLHAIGWRAESVVRLIVLDAVLVGALGGLTACAADLAGSLAVTHRVPAGVILVAASVAGLGVVISLVALGLAALARPGQRDGVG